MPKKICRHAQIDLKTPIFYLSKKRLILMQVMELITQDYISIDQNETVSRLFGRFITRKQKEAVVLDGKKCVGIVSKKAMLDSRLKADEVKIKKFIKHVNKLDKGTSLKKTCEQMVVSDCHILPVLYDDKRVEGVVLAKDLIRRLRKHAIGYKAKDIERTNLVKMDYHDPVGKAINTIRHNDVSHIPIIELSGHLVGLVSTIDILEKFMLFPAKREGGKRVRGDISDSVKQHDLMKMPIQNYMSKNVEVVKEDDDLVKVIDIMVDKNLSDVVIMKDEKPAGIITVKDILRLFSVV